MMSSSIIHLTLTDLQILLPSEKQPRCSCEIFSTIALNRPTAPWLYDVYGRPFFGQTPAWSSVALYSKGPGMDAGGKRTYTGEELYPDPDFIAAKEESVQRAAQIQSRPIRSTVVGPGDGKAFSPLVTIWKKAGERWENQMQRPVLVQLEWRNGQEAREFAYNLLDACEREEKGFKT